MIVYRPHRDSLEDAMKEAKTFLNEWEMKRYVANNWNLAIGRNAFQPVAYRRPAVMCLCCNVRQREPLNVPQ